MSTWRVETGDCLELLKTLADGSVDAVVTDPPYGVNYTYNTAFDDSDEGWRRMVAGVWPEIRRVCNGPILWFSAAPKVHRDMRAFDEPPKRTLVWRPKFTLSTTQANGLFFKWHPCYAWNLPNKPEGEVGNFDVFDDSCEGGNWWNHPATKPTSLMLKLVGFCRRGGVVLDPFVGSGTTGVACVMTGLDFIGYEMDAGYADIARRRIGEAASTLWTPPEPAEVQGAMFPDEGGAA